MDPMAMLREGIRLAVPFALPQQAGIFACRGDSPMALGLVDSESWSKVFPCPENPLPQTIKRGPRVGCEQAHPPIENPLTIGIECMHESGWINMEQPKQ